MKIKIYQIDLERDEEGVAFESLEWMKTHHMPVDGSIYETVFDGEVDADTLEDVYRVFNVECPENYTGRSLSVSDIVEVVEPPTVVGTIETESGPKTSYQFTDYASYVAKQEILREQGREFTARDCMGLNIQTMEPGCYYCDSVGFPKIEFDTEKAQEMKKNEAIKVVLVEPGKEARIAEIDNSLAGMQRIVGGLIEPFYPFEEQVCIICNDESKISGMPLNRAIREENQQNEIIDIIAGTFFICDCSGENFGSLSEEQLQRYCEKYRNPERFIHINGIIQAIPYKPQEQNYER